MAEATSAHRHCRNASNPYHVCSEYCFQVIGQDRKWRSKDEQAAALRRLREKISSHARGSKGRSTSDSVSTNARAAKRKVIAEAADPFPMIDPHVPVECAYIPSWSVKTTTSLLGVEAPEIAQWARYAVTPIDRISSEEASLEVCASRLNHAHYLAMTYSNEFQQKAMEQSEQLFKETSARQVLEEQVSKMSQEIEALKVGKEKAEQDKEEWKKLFKDAEKVAIRRFKESPAYKKALQQEVESVVSIFYNGGWSDCIDHALLAYPDLDRILLMEPKRLERRRKKAAAKGIDESELALEDDAAEFESPPTQEAHVDTPVDDAPEDVEDEEMVKAGAAQEGGAASGGTSGLSAKD